MHLNNKPQRWLGLMTLAVPDDKPASQLASERTEGRALSHNVMSFGQILWVTHEMRVCVNACACGGVCTFGAGM